MPRGTNHKKARQNNLQKARDSQKTVTVEEVPNEDDQDQTSHIGSSTSFRATATHCDDHSHSDLDTEQTWDLNLGNELPDMDCEESALGDLQLELDDEVVEAPEISDETELQKFSTLLSDAQKAAHIRDLEHSSNRPKHYTKKSASTLYRQRKHAKDMKEKGFLNVFDYIKGQKVTKEPDAAVSSAESDGEDEFPELEKLQDTENLDITDSIGTSTIPADCMDPVNLAHVKLRELLEDIEDPSPESAADRVLDQLNHTHFPALRCAAAALNVKSKNKTLDVFFRARITAMAGA
ncbi:hypothetical protein C8J57DRAFT_1479731, partial [Mycena rebaudengoi]